jgi:hypothetical protein
MEGRGCGARWSFCSQSNIVSFLSSFFLRVLFYPPYLAVIWGCFRLSFAAGIVIEDKNWPPFFPIIHHDINNEIPVHLQRTQYVAFASLLGMFSITSAQSDILTAQ